MDKTLILAVAGSGKTSLLVDRLETSKRTLILTFTENNADNLRRKILHRFGYMPPTIRLRSYFQFLISFCYRPYFARSMNSRGVTFDMPPEYTRWKAWTDDDKFLDRSRRIYYNRIARTFSAKGVLPDLQRRVARYFDAVYFDEVQDLGGHDFDLMLAIAQADLETMWVGDFHQRTYSTSFDGNVNSGLYKDPDTYIARISNGGLRIDTDTLLHSYRCGNSVCAFIRDEVGIEIYSKSPQPVRVIDVLDREEALRLIACPRTVKLFFQLHHKQGCYSENWGSSKGVDYYHDVCVVMNPETEKAYRNGELRSLKPMTLNKFYVACTRARGDLYLLPASILKTNKKKGKT